MPGRLHLLVYTHHYRTEPIGIGAFTGEMCEWLSGQHHQIRVVAPPPHYPEWAVQEPYRQWRYQSERISGVGITRCPLWVPSSPGGWERALSQMIFAGFSLPVMVREMLRRPDIAFVIEPNFLNAIVCLVLAKCLGRLCWLHIQDFEIDIAFALGQLKRGWIRSIAHWIESLVMKRFDVVSTISNQMLKKVREKGVEPSRSVLFPNWADTVTIFPLAHASSLRHELGISPDTIIALFSGTLGAKQGVELLIETAALLKGQKHIEFVICGNGSAVDALKTQAARLAHVHFLPLQPQHRLNDLLNMADIHLLPQKTEVADLVMPSKLLNMLASGRPIISTVNPGTEIARVVSQCGLVVGPNNPQAMTDAILYLSTNHTERLRLGEIARSFALRNFSHDSILRQFETCLYQRLEFKKS